MSSEENLQKILVFMHRIEKLKTIKRAVSISDNSRKESPAEHSWRAAILAILLHKELGLNLDILKAVKIVLIHDVVESIAGDVWILDKGDTEAMEKKSRRENEAADQIFSTLPEDDSLEIKKLWIEYENGDTKEAKFARALDRMEVIIQRADLGAKNWERNNIYDTIYHWADKEVAGVPNLKNFWILIQKEISEQFEKL